MRPGQQSLRVRHRRAIDADDVADGVDLDAVEAALAHPADELRRRGAVRVGEVGDGELAVLGEARVGVPRQQLGAIPRLLAEEGPDAEAVVEAQLGDAVDVAQRFGELEVRVVLEPALEGGDDLRLRQSRSARPAHGEHEREAEAIAVGGVQRRDLRELGRRARGEADAALLVARLGGHRPGGHRLAGELGVRAQQGELLVALGLGDDLDERSLELREREERAARPGPLAHPRRVLVGAGEQRDEVLVRRAVQARQGQHVVAHRRGSRAQRVTRTVFTTGCSATTWLRTNAVKSAGVPASSSRRARAGAS
jgi:hypothetical protein